MKTGIAILSVMSALWGVGYVYAAGASPWVYAIPVLISLSPIYLATKRRSPTPTKDEARQIGRAVGGAMIVEAVAIVGGIAGVESLGRNDLLLCAVAGGVGVHFIPLARWMPLPTYYLTGIALLIAAAVGVTEPETLRNAAVASSVAVILWVTAMSLMMDLPRADVEPA